MTDLPRAAFRGALSLGLALALTTPALAGPPLLCHPIEIDDAPSLAWDGRDGWRDTADGYDLSRLEADLDRLLVPGTPAIVRMETLRRAGIYAGEDQRLARRLLDTLAARAETGDALALFDYGYLVRIYKQAPGPMPRARHDGYAQVARALEITGDAEMAFAAAMIALHPRKDTLDGYLRTALDGAEPGSLLERNLVKQFSHRGTTVAALRKSAGLPAR